MNSKIISITLYYNQNNSLNKKIFMLKRGITLKNFLKDINVFELCPSFNFENSKAGVYGKIVRFDYIVKDNDRIEIYEPIRTTAKIRRNKLVENEK
jgi:putative ubiquitin-RnfH superfamily antitoxin RatB of RatAB toxin-antitoxin module